MQQTSKFLITSLPRSRTAWWSVLTSTPASLCLHEPLRRCQSFDDLDALWSAPEPQYLGVSDSGLATQIGRIMAEIQPRTLIIDRDIGEALDSFLKYFSDFPVDKVKAAAYFRISAQALSHYCDHPMTKIVRFADLHDFDAVNECYEWLMPDNPWPLRPDIFNMNIQADAGALAFEVATQPHTMWHAA